jgi:hypothetical protein
MVEVIHDWSISWPECPNHGWPLVAIHDGERVFWTCDRSADIEVPLGELSGSVVQSRHGRR